MTVLRSEREGNEVRMGVGEIRDSVAAREWWYFSLTVGGSWPRWRN